MSADFYKVDSARVTFREFCWEATNPLQFLLILPIAAVIKLCRITVSGNTDDLPVPELAPYQVALLPPNVQDHVVPLVGDLLHLGFLNPVYHYVRDPINRSTTALVTFLHPSGSIARVHLRLRNQFEPPKPKLFAEFLTPLSDGTFIWTLSGKPDMLPPTGCDVKRLENADIPTLWSTHQQRIATAGRTITPIKTESALLAALEQHQKLVWDFHTARGVFRPAKPGEQRAPVPSVAQPATLPKPVSSGGAIVADDGGDMLDGSTLETVDAPASTTTPLPAGPRHPGVLDEIDAIQNKKGSWVSAIWLLVFTVILFLAIGRGDWPAQDFLFLIPILFIHELGHYLTMRMFGYRNLRMFFIPFFGAAVTGRHYNIPGWKKVVVSLMGPLPGIFIGIVLGIVGMATHRDQFVHIAFLSIVINGFNLLPIMPLDGGHVVHALLFTRHYVLDVVFRVLAALTLLAVSIPLGGRMAYLGILMLVGIPAAYRMAKATDDLRRAGVRGNSADGQSIPPDLADLIVDKISTSNAKPRPTRILAQQTLTVFENLNARPPGWLATIGLLGVHAGTFFLVIVSAVVFVMAERHFFDNNAVGNFISEAARAPRHALPADAVTTWRGADYREPVTNRRTVVATFSSHRAAQGQFEQLTPNLPSTAGATLFGDSIFVTFAGDNAAQRDPVFRKLEALDATAFVEGPSTSTSLRMQVIAATGADAKALYDEVHPYLELSSAQPRLIAPWQVGTVVPSAEYDRYRKARSTLLRIRSDAEQAYIDPRVKEVTDKIVQARRQGNDALVKSLSADRVALQNQVAHESIVKLRDLGPDDIDHDFLDAYLAVPTTQPFDYYKPLDDTRAERLGLIPAADLRSAATLSRGGFVRHDNLFVDMTVELPDVAHAAPVIVQWLRDKYSASIRYDITDMPAVEADDVEPN
jgi:Zn-dependent protease